jgi:hypothetical protein
MKKEKQLGIIILNTIIFVALIGSAFAISFIFGALFVFGFAISIYNDDVKKKPWKITLLFIGGLITRLALGELLSTVSNIEITLDFAVSVLMIAFIFLLGWKIKRS